MRVVLADTHGPVMGKAQTSANLSLLYIAAYLRQELPGTEVVYLPQKRPAADHFDIVRRQRPDVYAVSFTSFGAPTTFALVRELRRRFPWLRVVLGGHHVTPCPRESLEASGADLAVIGEGEVTFAEVARNLHRFPEGFDGINGIAFFRDGRYVQTAPRALVPDIDDLPFPSRDLVDDRDYCGLSYRMAEPNTEMCITRGCPLRCVFCANPVFRVSGGPSFRARSPESIATEARQLYDLGYREIYLHSDELNVRLDWSIDVCKALAALKLPDLYFQCNMRVVPMSEEFAYWLRRANFWLIRFGIESANQRVLSGIKKQMSIENIRRSCSIIANEGIRVFGFFMMFQMWEENGELQLETAEEVQNTLDFAWELFRLNQLHYGTWGFTMPVPGAELWDIARRHGIIDDDYIPSDTWDVYEHLPHITKRQFNQKYRRARRLQAAMALKYGGFGLRNWMAIARKTRTMLFGKPAERTEFFPPE